MRRAFAIVVVSTVGALAELSIPAKAWDTCVSEPLDRQWLSVYLPVALCPVRNGVLVNTDSHSRNEHPEIADVSLKRLLEGGLFGVQSGVQLDVVDLNASLFRADTLKGTTRRALDQSLAPLETRELPAPARFAGLPDYSFTVYDWINKNAICPSLPAGAASNDLCHTFIPGWLGGLNSSHFGTQAARNYDHLHAIAVALAEKAADLRRKLEAADADGRHLQAYEKFVKEAELAALTYEGMAQHFLQDRWAVGHMWERWGSSNHDELQGGFAAAALLGGLTGAIHGSEAVFGPPDMMSSPDIDDGPPKKTRPAEFVQGSHPKSFAVGDYRFRDMQRGFFGGDYPAIGVDLPLPVSRQQSELLRCGMAGWLEVIRAFGEYKGGLGIHSARIAFDPGPLQDCFNPWVTNNTMKRGAVDDPVLGKALAGRVAFNVVVIGAAASTAGVGAVAVLLAADAVGDANGYSARELTRLFTRIYWDAYWDPDGTSLARGGIGDFDKFSPGQHFGASKFLEPRNLDELPDDDKLGRDKKSVHGFFNRALTEHWCRRLPETLDKLRGKDPDSAEAAVCAYLGDRAFDETDPKYKGRQAERRTLDGKSGSPPIKPICQVLGLGKFESGKTPAALHPGYVATTEWGLETNGPYSRAHPDVAFYSVKNWCKRVPVLDLVGLDELSAEDLTADIDDPKAAIAVRGRDLGTAKGKLRLRALDGMGGPFDITAIEAWSDTEIRFKLPDDRRKEPNDFLAMVTTSSGRRSVGRFIVRVRMAPPKIESLKVSRASETFYDFPKGGFRPVTPGQAVVDITFAGDMDRQKPLELQVGALKANGAWQSERSWQGKLEIPDGDAFKKLRGAHRLLIQAYTRSGGYFRPPGAKPDAPPVPDRTHRIVVDTVPPILERVTVTADGLAYDAEWTGGPEIAAVRSFIDGAVTPNSRKLNIKTARRLPARGSAEIELRFSADLAAAPTAHVGGAELALSGSGRTWRATFDIARAFAGGLSAGLEVSATDRGGNRLDGNPATLATLSLPPTEPVELWWLHDEDTAAAVDTGKGGTDAQHHIGERPPAFVTRAGGPLEKYLLPRPEHRGPRIGERFMGLVVCPVLSNFEWDEYGHPGYLFVQQAPFNQPLERHSIPALPVPPPKGLSGAELRRWMQDEQARVAAERSKAQQENQQFNSVARADHDRRQRMSEEFRRRADAASGAIQERQAALAKALGSVLDEITKIAHEMYVESNSMTWTADGWQRTFTIEEVQGRHQPRVAALCPGLGPRLAQLQAAQLEAVAGLQRILEEWWDWTQNEYARLNEAIERDGPAQRASSKRPAPSRSAEPAPQPAPPREKVVCQSSDWKGYRAEERNRGLVHDIVLQEIAYAEHALPDGGCVADLTTSEYAVSYGSSPSGDAAGAMRKPWSYIAKKASKVEVKHGASGEGAAALDAVRASAGEIRSAVVALETAQSQIQAMIERNLPN